uniref:Uncharacterized protein n=1 Tax=Arundo donax TaxID=35708 RepID=A0A0A9HJ07_ARUDO
MLVKIKVLRMEKLLTEFGGWKTEAMKRVDCFLEQCGCSSSKKQCGCFVILLFLYV